MEREEDRREVGENYSKQLSLMLRLDQCVHGLPPVYSGSPQLRFRVNGSTAITVKS